MDLLPRAIALCATFFLAGCIVSRKDLSESYPQVFPIDSGECALDNNAKAKYLIRRDQFGYTLKGASDTVQRLKFLSVPETTEVYISMLQFGNAVWAYDVISAPDKDGGITVYDFARRHQWLLPDSIKSLIVETEETYTFKMKDDNSLGQFMRTIVKQKIEFDPEITKLVCKPLTKPFIKPRS